MKAYCPDCMGALAEAPEGSLRCTIHGGTYRVLFQRSPLASSSPLPVTTAAGQAPTAHRCVQHPHLAATRQCQACGGFMCDTCDFVLPGEIHLCPSCATKPQTELSSKRKSQRAWSYGLAVFATFGLMLIFSGIFAQAASSEQGEEAVGVLFMFMVLVPAIIGMSLGLGAIDRRLTNPISLWIPTVWNGLMVALFLLLCLIGLAS